MNAAGMGTWRLDLRSGVDYIDESPVKLFGLTPGKSIRTIEDFYRIIHPGDRAQVRTAFEQAAEDGSPLDIEFRVVWPDGR